MIKISKKNEYKVEAKGILESVSAEGITVVDEKTGEVELLAFTKLKDMVGKPITVAIATKKVDEE